MNSSAVREVSTGMRSGIKRACLAVLAAILIPAAAPASALHDGVVTIFVEDGRGERIATGNGLVIGPGGVVATDAGLVARWLESDKNSLIVSPGSGGYYPLDSLISTDGNTGIAVFRIGAEDLKTAGIAPDYAPVAGESVTVIGTRKGLRTETLEATIERVLSDGVFELSASVRMPGGSPVLNRKGAVVAILVFRDGHPLAVPVGKLPSPAAEDADEGAKAYETQAADIEMAEAKTRGPGSGPEDYLRLGAAYRKAGMGEKAIEAFGQALRLRPDYAEAYVGLGVSLAGEGRYDEAIASLKRAVAIRPDYAAAHVNLGFLYDHLSRHAEAVASFNEALRLRPAYAEAYNGLGVSFARANNCGEAIKNFRQALRLRPEMKKARFNLALCHINLGDADSALREEALLRGADPALADRLLDFLEAGEGAEDEEGEGFSEGDSPEEALPEEGPAPHR